MAFDREEITKHDGLFGIERGDWLASVEYAEMQSAVRNSEDSREADLIYGSGNIYGIYQIREDVDESRNYRFAPMRELQALNLGVERANYELVYTAALIEKIEFLSDRYPALNNLYAKFNTEHPADFTGHSVSVSDVIVLKHNSDISSFYVDSTGFVEIDNFLGNEQTQLPEIPALDIETVKSDSMDSKENSLLKSELTSYSQVGNSSGSITSMSAALNTGHRNSNIDTDAPKNKLSLMERLEANKQKAAQHGLLQPETTKTKHLEVKE
jgi:hypothetical protein